MNNKKGFTLAEVMITLTVLGVLAAITVPAVMKLTPNSNAIMFRKGYSTLENVVSEMINNEALYPSREKGTVTIDGTPTADQPLGFARDPLGTLGYYRAFCNNIVNQINIVGANACDTSTDALTTLSFTTSDGIAWYLDGREVRFSPDTDFYNPIKIDVNGSKAPNCAEVAFTTPATIPACAAGTVPDQFMLGVRYDGKISILQNQDDEPQADAQGYLTDPLKTHK